MLKIKTEINKGLTEAVQLPHGYQWQDLADITSPSVNACGWIQHVCACVVSKCVCFHWMISDGTSVDQLLSRVYIWRETLHNAAYDWGSLQSCCVCQHLSSRIFSHRLDNYGKELINTYTVYLNCSLLHLSRLKTFD